MRRKTVFEIFESITEELCKRVGLEYPPPNGKKYEVSDAKWTIDEEFDFKMWMLDYMRQTTVFKRIGLKRITEEIDMFLFRYGWQYREEGNNETCYDDG